MKKNVASQSIGAQMVTASDGTDFTGSVTAYYTLDNGTQTIGSVGGGACTHEGNGYHSYAPTQGETNGDHIAWTFIGSGAITATVQVFTNFPQTVDNDVLASGATGFAAIDTVVDAVKVKTDFLPSATAGAAGGVFIAGTNAATTITTALTTTFTGNLTGSVDSVTNAVGSVTSAVTIDAASVDLILDETLTSHVTADSLGVAVKDILADTNELQTDNVPGLIATAQADLDTITDTDGVILGAAGVDLIWDEVINGGAHNTTDSAGRRLRELRESGFYTDGYIYIDTVNGADDETDYEAGTEVNPTSTLAHAVALSSSLGLTKFKVSPGSSITFAEAHANQIWEGHSWTLALGGQSIDGTTIIGADVTGIATNASDSQYIINCNLGAVTLPGDTHVIGCGLSGTQTMGEPGDYFYDNCHSAIAGSGSVTIDFATPATETNLNVRHHSGGWTVANMGAGAGTCNASFEGNGQITWAASCAATSNASIRGNWKITDNASGAVTETLDDNQAGVDAILADTNELQTDDVPGLIATAQADLDIITGADGANLLSGTQTSIDNIEADTNELQTDDYPARFTGIEGATFLTGTDSLEAIRDHIADGTNLTEAGGTGDHLSAVPWNAAWDAEVESEVNDALDTAIAELGVGAPTATPTIRTGLMLLYMALRNKAVVQTSGTDALEIYNNAGTKIAAKLLTDDGSDYTEAEMA
jgi:hypothetical protein